MNKIFITLDYELFFGSQSGTQYKSIIDPTNRLLTLLDKYDIKASFFIDSGYLIKLDEYRKKYDVLEKDYQEIVQHIKKLDKNGHDIQLHIHPHWKDSLYDGTKWVIDTSRYRLHQFDKKEIDDIVYRYKKVLTDIVGNKVFSFRAGGWCIQPFDKLKNALKRHNIWLDSTLFENGKNESLTHFFDFSNTPTKTSWRFENDPTKEDKNGFFTEIPISSYRTSPLFFWKFAFYKKFGGEKFKPFGDGKAASSGSKFDKLRMLTQYTNIVVSIDGYKSSLLDRAYRDFLKKNDHIHFIIIGHPKAMSRYSLEKLEEFILNNRNKNFTTYKKEFYYEK